MYKKEKMGVRRVKRSGKEQKGVERSEKERKDWKGHKGGERLKPMKLPRLPYKELKSTRDR